MRFRKLLMMILFMPTIKNKAGWNELEKRKATLNSMAMNALFCTLDKKGYKI